MTLSTYQMVTGIEIVSFRLQLWRYLERDEPEMCHAHDVYGLTVESDTCDHTACPQV